jgi:prepilin-type N-terminal cleavage/methylation domain-containing protein
MKNTSIHSRRAGRGFTLIELLVVIAIISILAAMLLPAISRTKTTAKVAMAKQDMKTLAAAINQYESTYSRLPGIIPPAPFPAGSDVTYGLPYPPGLIGSIATNTDIMLILMDIDTATPFPFSNNTNPHHAKNPQQLKLFDPKMVGDIYSPGLSTIDYQFRDPWGNPYVITLDMNYDGKCDDAFYRLQKISAPVGGGSAGYYGLSNTKDASGAGDNFELSGAVMVWSMGPDGTWDSQGTSNAKSGLNKDNVLGWQ